MAGHKAPTKAQICKIEMILEMVSNGESVQKACEKAEMPISSFCKHVKLKPFDEQYARAREMQADTHFDGLVDLEQEVLAGVVDPLAARVAIDARKWRLARMRPKVYGDRIDVTSSDRSMSPAPAVAVDLTHLTAAELIELTDKIFDNTDESEA